MARETRIAWGRLAVGLSVWIALVGITGMPSFAEDAPGCPETLEELQEKLRIIQDWKNRQAVNIEKMKAELAKAKAENRAPDVSKIGNVLATASGARSQTYQEAPPYIKAAIEKVEKNPIINLMGVAGLMGGVSTSVEEGKVTTAQAHYSVEIKRTAFLKRFLEADEKRVLKCIEEKRKKAASDCPPGAYQVACDPGMGDEPPFISDAIQPGQGFQGGSPWGSDHEPPTGPTEPGQPQPPDYAGPGADKPSGPGGTQAGGQGVPPGYWCYSEKTKEWYMVSYGPCPPPHMKPSGGSSVRVPWQGLVPPTGTVGTGGQCPPGCHIKPGTNECHCGGN